MQLDADALSELMGGAAHPNPKVRWECAHLMDHVGDDRCIEALVQLTHDPVPRVRAEALHALGCARCKPCALRIDAVALLVEAALTDPIARVRGTAVFTLGFLPADARAAKALERVAREDADQDVHEGARRALKHHSGVDYH